MEVVGLIIYMAFGIWAVNETILSHSVIIGVPSRAFVLKFALAFVLGWLLIPVAILKKIFIKG